MKLNWTVKMEVNFPEEKINAIIDYIRQYGWFLDVVDAMIIDAVCEFDDPAYYAWGEEQTEAVKNEIARRLNKVSKN